MESAPTRTYDATPEDVAFLFGVTARTVRRWTETTDIPHRRIGQTIRFNLDEVDAWATRGGRPTEEAASEHDADTD